jgi:UDP-glucose 4-epimerase
MQRAIKNLVVLGSGVMGSRIACHFAGVGVKVLLLDRLTPGAEESSVKKERNKLVDDSLLASIKSNPSPLYSSNAAKLITTGNFTDDISKISNADWIIEVVVERLDIKKLIYAASSSCYGIPEVSPTPETAEIKPQYPYAFTKWAGEQAALPWGKVYNFPVISLRLFNVYGPRSRTSGTYGAVFGVFLAQKLAGKPLTIVGDGLQTRDFTFVSDVAAAFLAAAESDVSDIILNVGSKNTYSIEYLTKLLGGDSVHIPKRPGEPDCTFADTTSIEKVLDWQPRVPFETGVQIMLENINYWRDAPIWEPQSIDEATKEWFSHLGGKNL